MTKYEIRNELLNLYRTCCDDENVYLGKIIRGLDLTDDEKIKYNKAKQMRYKVEALLLENEIPF